MGYRTADTHCVVRLLPLRNLNQQQEALCEALRREAGRCWTDMLRAHIESRGGKWLSSVELGKRFKGQYALHSQTIQALAQKLEDNVDAAGALKKSDPNARYPYRPKRSTRLWCGKNRPSTGLAMGGCVYPMGNVHRRWCFPYPMNICISKFARSS